MAKLKLSYPTSLDNLNALLNLPALSLVARLITSRCPSCDREYLENVLATFADKETNRCWLCYPAVKGLIKLIRLTCRLLDFEGNDLKNFLSEFWMRRIIINYVHGIAIFGRSRPQPVTAPIIAVWEITNECNLNCTYCHVDAKKALSDELNKEEKMMLVDELADLGTVALMTAGGEPLCSPDLFDIIKHAHDKGLYTVIITNGLLLSEENARKLIDAGLDYIKVSIDSASPKVHDSLRGNGSWGRAIQGIKNSVKAGLMTGIAFTLTRTRC